MAQQRFYLNLSRTTILQNLCKTAANDLRRKGFDAAFITPSSDFLFDLSSSDASAMLIDENIIVGL
jgi:hypothetical protein